MRIVIADAHQVFAEALATLLRKVGHEITGWATSLDEVISIGEGEQADVCIVDLGLPGSDRIPDAEAAIAAVSLPFVFLAGTAEPERFAAVAAAGARGIAMKSDDLVEILRVLHSAVAGRPGNRGPAGVAFSLAAQTVLGSRRSRMRPVFEPGQFLTQREREALASLVRGENTAAMARSMGVRVSTARSHVDAVLTKLGVHNRIEAVVYAVRAGLVDVPGAPDGGAVNGKRAASGLWLLAS